MIAGLANVRASVNQLVSALKVSLDEMSYTSKAPDCGNGKMLKYIEYHSSPMKKDLKDIGYDKENVIYLLPLDNNFLLQT